MQTLALLARPTGCSRARCFRAQTAPETLRARFERFGQVSREAMKRKHPRVSSFEDHEVGALRD